MRIMLILETKDSTCNCAYVMMMTLLLMMSMVVLHILLDDLKASDDIGYQLNKQSVYHLWKAKGVPQNKSAYPKHQIV